MANGAERKIAFDRGDQAWVASLDGTGAKKIASGVRPQISPDGKQLVFNTQKANARQIAVADVADGKMTIFTEIPSKQCYDATWSPDGSKISFRVLIDDQWRLGIVKADGSDFRIAKNLPADAPAWSRDGNSMFCYDFDNLYQINLEGSVLKKWELKKILPEPGPEGSGQVMGLSVSPDGQRLLVDVDFGGPAGIYAFALDTEKMMRVTQDRDVAFDSCWLTNEEFLCVIFKSKEKANMRSVYRISLHDKTPKLLIKDAVRPSVSAP